MHKRPLKPGEYRCGDNLRKFTPVAADLKRMDIRLHNDWNSDQVYWSVPNANSYVVCDNPTGCWTAPNGIPCDLLSINGHGDIRWAVTSECGDTSGDLNAVQYFGLKWHGWRS